MQVQTQYLSGATMTAFKQAMQNAGIEPPADVLADGAIHRFTVARDRVQRCVAWLTSDIRNLAEDIGLGDHHED